MQAIVPPQRSPSASHLGWQHLRHHRYAHTHIAVASAATTTTTADMQRLIVTTAAACLLAAAATAASMDGRPLDVSSRDFPLKCVGNPDKRRKTRQAPTNHDVSNPCQAVTTPSLSHPTYICALQK